MAHAVNCDKTLADMPADAVAQCAEFLGLRDVANLAMACKSLRTAAYSDDVWFRLFKEKWPKLPLPSGSSDIRGKYINRLTATQRMIFSDPSWCILSKDTPQPVNHLILDKSNFWASMGSDAQLWRPNKFASSQTLKAHGSRITSMRLISIADTWLSRSETRNTDNLLVTSSADRTIRLWWKGKSQRCFKGHSGPVTALADKLLGSFGDTKVLASGSEDCTVRVWSVSAGHKNHAIATYHGHEKPLSFLTGAWHRPSLLISISKDSKLRAWDISASGSSPCVGNASLSGTPVGLKCHDTICNVATRSSMTAVDLRTMQRAFTLPMIGTEVCSFEILPAKSMMCTGLHDRALLWDIRKLSIPIADLDSDGEVTLLHMDTYKVVTAGPSNHHVKVWDPCTGELLNSLNCSIPGEDMLVTGISAMSVEGCRIVTTSCTSEMGELYYRDFSNSTTPVSLEDSDTGPKFWGPND